MFSLNLDNSPVFHVKSRSGTSTYATDGTAPNPFEAAIASIAGCAGVYAHKACAAAGVSSAGIGISLKPSVAGSPTDIRKIAVKLSFPEGFDAALIPQVLASVGECPVKALIQHGDRVEFSIDAA